MSFPESVAAEALVLCGRSCCICHKFCGTKIELHHIKPKACGGDDTLDNCIPVCFDCHADMGKADPKHPKGKRYSEKELKLHRDSWYEKVKKSFANAAETRICKEDIDLFHTICNLFTPEVKYWLTECDIGGSHPYSIFVPFVNYLHNCNDPFFEFIDPELEKLKGNLFSYIKVFLSYKAKNTFVKMIGGENQCVTREWMVSHEDWAPQSMTYEEYSVQYSKEAQTLNDLATDVWEAFCVFVRQGRLRLSQ